MTLVKTVRGTDIVLTPDGRFRAVVGDKTIARSTLAAVEAKLKQQVPGALC